METVGGRVVGTGAEYWAFYWAGKEGEVCVKFLRGYFNGGL